MKLKIGMHIVLLSLILILFPSACSPSESSLIAASTETGEISDEIPADTPVAVQARETPENATTLINPADLVYLGAFRLPEGGERPATFEYGGSAMAFSPIGDPQEEEDGFPGSLFIMGHDRLPYGELPDGNQVAEVSIPQPVLSDDLNQLPVSSLLQPFTNIADGHFTTLNEIPRIGMVFLDHPLTGPLIHIAWGAHFQDDEANAPSHGWFSLDLTQPDFQGEWFLADASLYSINGYLFTIPADWAEQHVNGMQLAAGRYRDGGWSGMGPSLYAYQPWLPDGSPAPSGTELADIPLLQYEDSYLSDNFTKAMSGYSHADEWEGGAWLADEDGRSAVIFVGTKATGEKSWYGWQNPLGAEYPCIERELRDEFTTCRLSDGTPCPAEDLQGCDGHNDYRGWWSSEYRAQVLFYNPDDLAQVAAGTQAPWEPQPYAVLDIDDTLLHNPNGVEVEMLGSGVQRRYRIGETAYDAGSGLLYILELFADGARPVVHVWRIASTAN